MLVRGDYGKKRGIFLGRVTAVSGARVRLDLAAPVKNGDGVVFDGDDAAGIPEQGGRVYEVAPAVFSAGPVELGFGRHDIDLRQIHPGQRLWKTDDPELTRRLRSTFEGPAHRKVEVSFHVRAATGEPLRVEGRTATGFEATVISEAPLALAERNATTEDLFREQLSRLGGTIYELGELTVALEGAPMVPKSLLNALRRDLVARLDEAAARPPARRLAAEPVLPALRAPLIAALERETIDEAPTLAVLCRNVPQIEAAVASGVRTIYAEFQDITHYKEAVAAAGGASLFIATPRIQKPNEGNIFRYLARQGADGLLVRNAGGLYHCAEQDVPFVADFSLNAANELTVAFLKERGALRVTASYDLSFGQPRDLIGAVPRSWLEVVIHQQIPMFHMEHCVFCAVLSPGTDKTNCGRPCDHHDVKLKDRTGRAHPLKADVGCRNTLFNAVPQTAAEYLPELIARGARHLRIEFLDDDPTAVARTIGLYRDALTGHREAKSLWRDLKATSKYGVTRGALNVL